MRRDLDEVMESQEKMRARLSRLAVPRDQMKQSFAIHLDRLSQWLMTQSHMQVLEAKYNQLVNDPATEVRRIAEFLDHRPSVELMISAIDPSLDRNQKTGRLDQ